MGFCPDSETNPDVPCRRKKGRITPLAVHILLLCCLNLITSMAQDKAVHCGKSFFHKKSLCWINAPQRNGRLKRHTQRWGIVSKYVTAQGFV